MHPVQAGTRFMHHRDHGVGAEDGMPPGGDSKGVGAGAEASRPQATRAAVYPVQAGTRFMHHPDHPVGMAMGAEDGMPPGGDSKGVGAGAEASRPQATRAAVRAVQAVQAVQAA